MKLNLYRDAMTIVPETALDQAFLEDTLTIPGEDKATVVCYRRNNPQNGEVAELVFIKPSKRNEILQIEAPTSGEVGTM